ncbi:uncharacterized protein LOC118479063 [Aplysia californica]|uniref:Uncharacterized protein LOC118479063 n=1 Tax=Aplysia californica TaxID=6500 RepID=A0ABM1W4H9_APLCA|nr:uncharacterized protein LOC118479063 [Aplysia californica]
MLAPSLGPPAPAAPTAWDAASLRQLSSLHPWSSSLLTAIKEGKLLPPPAIMRDGLASILPSYLHTGPPVLLNPERVIPYSESQRYERHFTPNVSLAPSSGQKSCTEDEEEEVDEKSGGSSLSTSVGVCNNIVSEPSLSRKASHTSSKFEGERRGDTMEYDLPTDTDDSSMASPTDSCKDIRLLDTPLYESTVEREMDLLRSALHGKIEGTPEARSRFMQDFAKMRAKTEETIQWLLSAHAVLKRDLEVTRRHNVELQEMVAKAEQDLQSLSLVKEYALTHAHSQHEQLHKGKIDRELEERVRSLENLYRDVCTENHSLRRELAALGEKAGPVVKYTATIAAATPRSRLRMALDSGGDSHFDFDATDGGRGEKEPGEIEVKRERDITVD